MSKKLSCLPYLRIISYLSGLMILALGIATSVRSNLGISPVASVPYMFSLTTGMDFGFTTTLWQGFLIFLQIVILRREFKTWMFLQIITCFVFGYFNTVAGMILQFLPAPESFVVRLLFVCIGFTLCGLGIWLYSSSEMANIPSEGLVFAISYKLKKPFHTIKIAFDVTSVLISVTGCMAVLNTFGSVGIGTIIISVMQGTMVGVFARNFGSRLKAAFVAEKKRIMRE